MYIPAHYKIENPELTKSFITQYNFGLLLCNGSETPTATHIPFYFQEKNNESYLITHVAKANPQWKFFETNKKCLVIFEGPNGYVSPSLYSAKQNVPTWNYMAVHVTGEVELIHDDKEMRELMHLTMEGAEKAFIDQYNSLPSEYLNAMYSAIVFFRIKVTGIETKFKLSQNKPEEDQARVADKFEADGNRALADWMRKINAQK
jgi:transcriptional regulator